MLTVFAEPTAQATDAAAQASQIPGWQAAIVQFAPFIVIIAVFYFLMIRPQKKKDKEAREMLASIKVGDKITTIGGMVGKITKIKDEKVIFETGPKTEPHQITIERWAIKAVEKITTDED